MSKSKAHLRRRTKLSKKRKKTEKWVSRKVESMTPEQKLNITSPKVRSPKSVFPTTPDANESWLISPMGISNAPEVHPSEVVTPNAG